MSNFTFRPAERTQAKPLIGIYAESGCGKTFSSLLLARGFVGASGRIGMIETEAGRGEAYSDKREYPEIGGYDVLSLRDDFSPTSYGKAIAAAEKADLGALIIDSSSHEWEGVGGVLDMAANNQAGGKTGVLVWQQPKILHKREFMLRLLASPIPLIIVCMRAKYPMKQIKAHGKIDWQRSDVLEPIQADDILFEMFVHFWIDKSHKVHLTKSTARALESVFVDDQPITAKTGADLAAWARGATPASSSTQPKAWGRYDTPEEWGTAAITAIAGFKDAATLEKFEKQIAARLPAYAEWNIKKHNELVDLINATKSELAAV